mmetsp:Transcript_20116/g.44036  ORF Transcript_20116/g.44036 Transcript_20116/m.44036 type:complete len:321 (-) Transcript_20116:77-1039(-)
MRASARGGAGSGCHLLARRLLLLLVLRGGRRRLLLGGGRVHDRGLVRLRRHLRRGGAPAAERAHRLRGEARRHQRSVRDGDGGLEIGEQAADDRVAAAHPAGPVVGLVLGPRPEGLEHHHHAGLAVVETAGRPDHGRREAGERRPGQGGGWGVPFNKIEVRLVHEALADPGRGRRQHARLQVQAPRPSGPGRPEGGVLVPGEHVRGVVELQERLLVQSSHLRGADLRALILGRDGRGGRCGARLLVHAHVAGELLLQPPRHPLVEDAVHHPGEAGFLLDGPVEIRSVMLLVVALAAAAAKSPMATEAPHVQIFCFALGRR